MLAPVFTGSALVGGPDADVIASGLLLDVKADAKAHDMRQAAAPGAANGQSYGESKPRSLTRKLPSSVTTAPSSPAGLPETRFLSRVQALETRLTELRAQSEDLKESDRKEVLVAPTAQVMRSVKETLRDAMRNGTPGQRKALLEELVVEVKVESRDSIIPTFRLPTAPVRVMEAVVGRRGLEPRTSALSARRSAS